MADPALVIIARPPRHGRVKTRLAAGIGADGALAVYRQLLAIVARVARRWPGPVLLAADGHDGWDGTGLEGWPRRLQPATHLGGRIADALAGGLAVAPAAIAIGTDCPGLHEDHLRAVARGLASAPLAFGPARDGGYWAIAATAAAPLAVACAGDLPWSTPELLAATRARLTAAGCRWREGPVLADCDDRDDLLAAIAAGLLQPAAPTLPTPPASAP